MRTCPRGSWSQTLLPGAERGAQNQEAFPQRLYCHNITFYECLSGVQFAHVVNPVQCCWGWGGWGIEGGWDRGFLVPCSRRGLGGGLALVLANHVATFLPLSLRDHMGWKFLL